MQEDNTYPNKIKSSMDISQIRFIDDDPANYLFNEVSKNGSEEYLNRLKRSIFSSCILITEDLFPGISGSIEKTNNRLQLDINFEVFIQPNASFQSLSIPFESQKQLAIIITSSLINLLNQVELQFVLGHEIAHKVFKHFKYPAPEIAINEYDFLQSLYLSRCAEISADRLGLLACGSLDDAILGMIKISSGLSREHLRADISSYISQLKKNKDIDSYKDQVFNTHPIFPLRARALIWFSMSERYYELSQNNKSAPITHEQLETMIRKDFYEISDKLFIDKETELINNALLWASLKLALADNVIAKEDQILIKQHVPTILVDKAINFLKQSSTNAKKMIEDRLKESLNSISNIRKSKKIQFDSEINKIAKKFDTNLNDIKDKINYAEIHKYDK